MNGYKFILKTLKQDGDEFTGYTDEGEEIRIYEVLDELMVEVNHRVVHSQFIEELLTMDEELDDAVVIRILENLSIFEFDDDFEFYSDTTDEFDAYLNDQETGEDLEDMEEYSGIY